MLNQFDGILNCMFDSYIERKKDTFFTKIAAVLVNL
jgi:hypothetical protein